MKGCLTVKGTKIELYRQKQVLHGTAGMEPFLSFTGVSRYQCKNPCYLKVCEIGSVLTVLFVVAWFTLRSRGEPALAMKHLRVLQFE